MATPQAYSDLIYLFLDGEATETERSVLFSALKDSPGLQEEFASAVHVRGALVNDAMKLQAPAFIESQIMQKAGLLASQLPIGAAASSALTTAPTAAAPLLVKAGLLIALGAASGVATFIGIQNYSKFSATITAKNSIAAPNSIARPDLTAPVAQLQMADAQNLPPSSVQNTATARAADPNTSHDHSASSSSLASLMSRRSTSVHSTSAENEALHASSVKDADHSSVDHDVSTTTSSTIKPPIAPVADPSANKNIADNSTAVSQLPNEPVPSESHPEILPAMLIADANASHDIIIGDQRSERNPLRANEFRSTSANWLDNVSAQINYLGNAGMSSGRDVHGDDRSAWNMSGSVNYDLTEALGAHFDVGLSVGNESFPIYLKSGNKYKQSNAIWWGGASVGYTFDNVVVPEAHLFASVLGGVSTPGAVVRPEVGARYDLAENVSVSASASDMFVLFQNNGQATNGSKWGVNTGIAYRF